jgi:hypothetical protein
MKVEFSDCDTRPSDNVNVEHLIEQIIGNTNDSLQEAGVKNKLQSQQSLLHLKMSWRTAVANMF